MLGKKKKTRKEKTSGEKCNLVRRRRRIEKISKESISYQLDTGKLATSNQKVKSEKKRNNTVRKRGEDF